MKYIRFHIENYRGITNRLTINLKGNSLIPLIGINECGKTTILQAIFCYDSINDNEYDKKHLKNTLNLYKTSDDSPPIVSADIEIKKSELKRIIEDWNLKEESQEQAQKKLNKKYDKIIFDVRKSELIKDSQITISRNLETKEYSFVDDNLLELNVLCGEIISRTPYILYNDDFMDRPPNEVEIPNEKPEVLTDWLSIYERLFNTVDKKYSLFELVKETDERRRASIVSDVEELLNTKLAKAWKTFLLSNHGTLDVKLDFNLSPGKNILSIKIVERINRKERFFEVEDRSKGFLWFFNFVMKLEFNPKIIGNKKDTLFLLDEPGSYLHSSAQEKLCKKLKDISEKDGNVIYCTHSHHLLNPEIIPLNKIYIIEKEKNKNIKATPLPQVKLKKDNINAYQPVIDALQIPNFVFLDSKKAILAVEGIYDKYAIELFCEYIEHLNILPGTSADSIIKNIQFLNGFSKRYIAIWDNDEEGRKKYDLAAKTYGLYELRKFDKLPLLGRTNRRMEDMFENNDIQKISDYLQLPKDSDYEKIISNLYFSKHTKRKGVKDIISDETKENFKILKEIILKRLKEAEDLESFTDWKTST